MLALAQGFFDPDALGDVAENNGDFWAFRVADTGCVDVEPPALQRLVLCYKTNRFARARDLAADLQPTHFNARQDFSQAFARNVMRSGLCGKGRIDLQKTAIDRLMLFIEDDFYDLTLRSSLKFLKLIKSAAGGIDEKLEPQSKGVDLAFDAQAFEFENGINRHEDVVALGSQRLRWRLGHACVGLQGFVKHLHLPPFFVGRGNGVIVAREVTANQMQYPRAAVLVFKDLAD